MAGPMVVTKCTFFLVLPAGDPGGALDLSCHTIAFEITPSTDEIDVGSFCAPSLSDVGRTTYSAVVTFLWSPELYNLLQPHLGKLATAVWGLPGTAADQGVEFASRIVAQPWGRFELGQRVEVELPLPVLSTPIYNPDRLP